MEKKNLLFQGCTALLIAAAVLFSTMLLANRVSQSPVYRQSKVFSLVISQQSVGITDIIGDRRNFEMLAKFAGAVTSAYINFELIPVYEADTFVVIFECVNSGITLDKFEYRRKNLAIDGSAVTEEDYEKFVSDLREKRYFESVSGDSYTATDDSIRFQIVCASAQGIA